MNSGIARTLKACNYTNGSISFEKALLSLGSAFKMIEGSHHIVQKMVYCLGNVVNLGLALYKCQSMGLLPTHASDWLAFIQPQERVEWFGGGVSLL